MFCEIDKNKFVENLSGVVSVLMTKTSYPILQNVFLEITDNNLIIKATDLDSYIEKRILIEKGKVKPGKAILPGKKLLEATKELLTEKLTITTKDNKIHIETKGSSSFFVSIDPNEYPEVPEIPKETELEIPQTLLEECYSYTGFAVSKEESRPPICGIYLKISENEIRMVATDTFRLAFAKKKEKFDGNFEVIIAPKVFSLFPKGEDKVKVLVDSSKIAFVFANTTIISRLIEGPYPDYERIIPQKYESQLQVNTETFIGALRRAAVFAHPAGRLIELRLSAKQNSIFAETADLGHTTQEFEAKYTGDSLKIGFNVNYLLEIISALKSEEVIMQFINQFSTVVIKPKTDQEGWQRQYLLMPIRLE
ncbi:MAG: DNA polymerase III subunit beta [candidate division WOR-3 bacterium]